MADITFRHFSSSQAATYAKVRRGRFPDALFEKILNYHTSHGGAVDRVVDFGCGPGVATLDLARFFSRTTGLDAGASMIEVARATAEMDERKAEMGKVDFHICAAERCFVDGVLPEESADVVTAAQAVGEQF